MTVAVTGNAGPETGLAVVVALRDTLSSDYLDFSDNTFKAAGWTTKKAALTELGNGFYNRNLDLTGITNLNSSTKHLGLEFEVTTVGKLAVVADYVTLRSSLYDVPAALLAKVVDGTVTVQTIFARCNSWVRGLINLDTISAAPDTDVEYFAEDGLTKLFENRKSPSTRTPQP